MQSLINVWGRIKPYLPMSIRSALVSGVQRNRWLYRKLLFRYIDAKDRSNGIQNVSPQLPSAELRYRVSSSPDANDFLKLGEICARDLQSSLNKIGSQMDSFSSILDFGCGCGRTLRHLPEYTATSSIYGADIDGEAIKWCQEHLTFAEFSVIVPSPPTSYPPEKFDLIYAISVFTHLNEDHQFSWLKELRRIAKPGAILLLTVDSNRAGREGFTFTHSYEKGIFPEWYQNAYHSKEYVMKTFSSYFDILSYIPQGMSNHQDVVILRKTPTG
jgi:SAM-dependent methyltransferase